MVVANRPGAAHWLALATLGLGAMATVDDVDVGALRLDLGRPARHSVRSAQACAALGGPAEEGGTSRIPNECSWDVPVIWEFPGSGSTWFRRVLEEATGFPTGSAVDGSASEMIYDQACGKRMLGIAASSSHIFYEMLRHGSGRLPWHGARPEVSGTEVRTADVAAAYRSKCSTWRCSRALIVDRDPYDAILSSYVSTYAANFEGGADELDVDHFESAALRLAADYTSAWATYTTFVRRIPSGERQTLVIDVDVLRAACPAAMGRVLAWLAPPLPPRSADPAVTAAQEAASADRLARACALAARRSPDDDRPRGPQRHAVPSSLNLTRIARRAWRRQTVCRVWSVIGHIARDLGHRPTLGMRCIDRNELAIALATDAARSSPDSRTIVLATINLRYIDVFFNWSLHLARFGHARTMIVGALDWWAHDLLSELSAPVFPLIPRFASGEERRGENQRAFDGIWIERGAVAGALLNAGFNVLLCDSDAVWTANVLTRMPALYALKGSPVDAIASAGTFPQEAAQKLGGHTAVMGFVLLRSTPPMIRMFNASQRRAHIVGDDQVAFNLVLASGNVHVQTVLLPDEFTSRARTATLIQSRMPAHEASAADSAASREPVRLLMVSDQLVVRNCSGIKEHEQLATSMVAHCLSDKNGGAKSEQLQIVGLWICPIAWLTQLRERVTALAEEADLRLPAAQRSTARTSLPAIPALPSGTDTFVSHLSALSEASGLTLTIVVTSTWLTGLTASYEGAAPQAQEAWDALRSLARGLAAGLHGNGLRAELIVMHWPQADEDNVEQMLGSPWIDGTHAGALCVRVVRIPAALHQRALRRQSGKLPAMDTVALNAGIRLARANHVLCVSLNTRFTAGFFAALAWLRGHGLSHSAHVVSSCRIANVSTLSALGGIPDVDAAARAHCHNEQPSGAIGVLLPKSLWHIVRGMPEGVVSGPYADRYLAQRISAHGIQTSWLLCGRAGGACAVSASGRWTRWWRTGEATQGAIDSVSGARTRMRSSSQLAMVASSMRAVDELGRAIPAEREWPINVRLHANQLRAECEVALLSASHATGGFDATCDWGLVGQAMLEERRIEAVEGAGAGGGGAKWHPGSGAPLPTASWRIEPEAPSVPGFESDVDDSVNGGCWSTSRQLREWTRASLLVRKGAPMLMAHVMGDLSQRQLALASAWALAVRLGYVLAVVWERTDECGGSFDELFMRNASVLVLDAAPTDRAPSRWVDYVDGFATGNSGGNGTRRLVIERGHIASGLSLYVRTLRMTTAEGVPLSAQELGTALAWIRPRVSDIAALGYHVVKLARLRGTVGISIRMHAAQKPARGLLPKRRKDSLTDHLFALLNNVTGTTIGAASATTLAEKMRFFLSCDDDECYTSMRKHWRRRREVYSMRSYFPGAWEVECSADEHSPRCQRLALFKAEVLLQQDKYLFSQPSAFSDVLLLRRIVSPRKRAARPSWLYMTGSANEDTSLGGVLTGGALPASPSHKQFVDGLIAPFRPQGIKQNKWRLQQQLALGRRPAPGVGPGPRQR